MTNTTVVRNERRCYDCGVTAAVLEIFRKKKKLSFTTPVAGKKKYFKCPRGKTAASAVNYSLVVRPVVVLDSDDPAGRPLPWPRVYRDNPPLVGDTAPVLERDNAA